VERTLQVAARDEGRAAGDLRGATAKLLDRSVNRTEDIMATNIAPAAPTQAAGLHRLGAAVTKAWTGYWQYRANRAAVVMLHSLDAQALRDMGITHGEIESVVYRRSREDTRR
jgi:uncharacterized protein YjiS (DUF1127 family)